MAPTAEFGLLIRATKAGTVLNVLPLIQAGKIAALIDQPEKTPITSIGHPVETSWRGATPSFAPICGTA